MTMRIQIAAAAVALLSLAGCGKEQPPPPPPDSPRIVSFKADRAEANPGQAVKLTYEVENASSLELVDDSGGFIALQGDSKVGEATVAPLRTHFYVLRASGKGGRDSAFVQVAVGEPLKDVFLVAVPPAIQGGESAQLLWGAARNKTVELASSAGDLIPLGGDSGAVTVTPARTTTYTLVADPGTGAPKLSAAAEVRVNPVIRSFTVTPGAAHAGETLTLSWKAAGATRVVLTEATFGALYDTADLAEVASSEHAYTLPTTYADGSQVQDGLPLRFQLRVVGSPPDSDVLREVVAYVGALPTIQKFELPLFVTEGKTLTAAWSTLGAASVAILLDGQKVFETLPGDTARVTSGTVTLPAPSASGRYELRATNTLGLFSSSAKNLTVVKAPAITTFSLSPTVSTAGGPATAAWTTQNATQLNLRTQGGANVYSTSDTVKIGAGSLEVGVGQTVSLSLEVMNEAGDVATQTKTVTVPPGSLLGTTPPLTLAGVPLQVAYDLSSVSAIQLFGVPTAVPTSGSSGLVDLSDPAKNAKELTFSSGSDAVTAISPGGGFRFPFFGERYQTFHVRTDGVVGLTAQLPASSDNVDLTAAKLGQALAPFWETLELGASGKVHWLLEGQDFPRRLIVQWSHVAIAGVSGTDLTFQAQLLESGEFRFLYGTMTGTGALGEDATVGVQAQAHGWSAQHPSNAGTAAITANSELVWFAPTTLTGSFTASFPGYARFTVMGLSSFGRWLVVEAPIKSFPQNSVLVSELMPVPEGTVAATGQWVELENTTESSVDVGGLVLSSTGASTGYTLPPHELAPGAVLVVGQSTALGETGGATVQYAFPLEADGGSALPMSPTADTLSVLAGNGTVSSLAYAAAPPPGRSLYAPQPYAIELDGGTVPVACPTDQTFNQAQTAFGTPGTANAPCLPYKVSSIAGRFEDISSSGVPVFASTSSDDQYVTFQLPRKVKYFGQEYQSAIVSSNGWVTFGTATSSVFTNRVIPSASTSPQGAIAVHWDDLYMTNPGSNVYGKRVEPGAGVPVGYSILSWHRMRHSTGDEINAQVKLFDDGVIELHYGELVNGTSSNYATGKSATVWLEQPGVARALAVNRDQDLLRPNTGYRFVPVP